MGSTSSYCSSSATGQNCCTSDSSNDTVVKIGIIIGIVIGSLSDISIIISVILITCITMKKLNSLPTISLSLQTSQPINLNYY